MVETFDRCSGFGRYQAVETFIGLLPMLFEGCSGFGRYQAVETASTRSSSPPRMPVAVGLAAIRPLKRGNDCRSHKRAMALQWVWPLSGR